MSASHPQEDSVAVNESPSLLKRFIGKFSRRGKSPKPGQSSGKVAKSQDGIRQSNGRIKRSAVQPSYDASRQERDDALETHDPQHSNVQSARRQPAGPTGATKGVYEMKETETHPRSEETKFPEPPMTSTVPENPHSPLASAPPVEHEHKISEAPKASRTQQPATSSINPAKHKDDEAPTAGELRGTVEQAENSSSDKVTEQPRPPDPSISSIHAGERQSPISSNKPPLRTDSGPSIPRRFDRFDRPPVRVWTDRSQESELDYPRSHRDTLSIAETLDCHVKVYTPLDEEPQVEVTVIRWLMLGQYREVRSIAERLTRDRLIQEYGLEFRQKKTFPTDGRVSLVRVEDSFELGSEELVHEGHWNERVPKLVGGHGSENLFKPLRLDVVWRVEFVSIFDRKGNKPLSVMVYEELEKILAKYKNIHDEKFLPRKELDAIFDKNVVDGLITEDKTLAEKVETWDIDSIPEGKPKLQHFVDEVWKDATRLLATCLYTDRACLCLFNLIRAGKRDVDLPLNEANPPPGASAYEFRSFWPAQKQFSVFQFDRFDQLGSHLNVPEGKVVPIMFKNRNPLGKGGFGEVFEVTIHRHHHNFEARSFALKRLYETAKAAENFEQETQVLADLRNLRHVNITVPLTAWQQSGRFYMLFPLAQSNLKTYLRSQPAPTKDKAFVLGVLENLVGLADALDSIHTMKDSALPGANMLLTPEAGTARQRTGYHHDLKPENILIFGGNQWQIHDFGTARLSEAVSGGISYRHRELSAGDPDYRAPDWEIEEWTSRPYDIWSFGCIILEVLIWIFETGGGDRLGGFEMKRLRDTQGGVAAFWFRHEGEFKRRPSVEQKLVDLEEWTEGFAQFNKLLRLVRRMLQINLKDRPDAKSVFSDLRTIRRGAEAELSTDPQYYIHSRAHHRSAYNPATDQWGTPSHSGSFNEQADQEPAGPGERRLSPDSPRMRRLSTSSTARRQHEAQLRLHSGGGDIVGTGAQADMQDEPSTPRIQVTSDTEPSSPEDLQRTPKQSPDPIPPYQSEMRRPDYLP